MGKRHGRLERCDAVTAFLAQVLDDPKLTVVTEALATRVLIEGGRAVGVEYVKDPVRAPRPCRAPGAGGGRHLQRPSS
ncbi:MAG: GMC family oxidoreductase N-terminal domain-containing protein [Geminicoccaceae bacterium]